MLGETILHYKILEKLGEGGMGVVYKADDARLKRLVALKFLPPYRSQSEETVQRFRQEAQAAATLNHPNICIIHDLEEREDSNFIVMEFVEGASLRKNIPIDSIDRCISYAVQIGEALHEAHSHDIVHRDIKADNIMVNKRDQIKVMDFGLAKIKGSIKLTHTSGTVGTLGYMSPEQIQGGTVDSRSDIFSFGVLLYEMLAGRLPFRGEHEAAIVYSIVNEAPQPMETVRQDVPDELSGIILRALEKDPQDRYQHVDDMVADLRHFKHQTSGVRPSRMGPRVQKPAKAPLKGNPKASKPGLIEPRRSLAIGAGAAFLFTIVFLGYYLFHKPETGIDLEFTTRVLHVPFTQVGAPGLSRDGTWITFPAGDANDKWDIYFMNTAGGEPRKITDIAALEDEDVAADLSPDGTTVAFDLSNSAEDTHALYVVPSLGGASKKIAPASDFERWSPDGKRIGFIWLRTNPTPSASGFMEFWTVDPESGKRRREFIDSLTIEGSFAFTWSPDGKSIAWVRDFSASIQEIIVRELATGNERRVTNDKHIIIDVLWVRDNVILYSSDRSGNSDLWALNLRDTSTTRITKAGVPDQGLAASANGSRIVYLESQDYSQIQITDTRTGKSRQAATADRSYLWPSLSPDGSAIASSLKDAYNHREYGLYVMDATGRNQRRLTPGMSQTTASTWSPDGKWIAFIEQEDVLIHPDSGTAYVVALANPGSPLPIGDGTPTGWIGNDQVVVRKRRHSVVHNLSDNTDSQYGPDSVYAYPSTDTLHLLYLDERPATKGFWIAPFTDHWHAGIPRKLLDTNTKSGELLPQVSGNGKYVVYKNESGIWHRIQLPGGRDEELKYLPSTVDATAGLSYDSRYLIYNVDQARGELIMIDNLFKQ